MSEIERQLAAALRDVEGEREALRKLLLILQNEYELTRRDNARLSECVELLSERVEQLARALSTSKAR